MFFAGDTCIPRNAATFFFYQIYRAIKSGYLFAIDKNSYALEPN